MEVYHKEGPLQGARETKAVPETGPLTSTMPRDWYVPLFTVWQAPYRMPRKQ